MRNEAKVYLSHVDGARIVAACRQTGESVSSFMRRCALAEADRLGVSKFKDLGELVGQLELETGLDSPLSGLMRGVE